SVAWGGGYWLPLARALNIPLRLHLSMPFQATIFGSGRIFDIPFSPTAAGITDVLLQLAPFPVEEVRETFCRVAHAGFAIPYDQLQNMQHVSMLEWMTEQGADEVVSLMLMSMLAGLLAVTSEQCREVSVYGGW